MCSQFKSMRQDLTVQHIQNGKLLRFITFYYLLHKLDAIPFNSFYFILFYFILFYKYLYDYRFM